jgi:hypothetical protein
MSEKIYVYLLRIFPSAFRRHYEEEALRLIRDRLNDEKSFLLRIRLSFDLIRDIVGALPQAYRNSYAEVAAAASLTPQFDGVPSFRILQKEPLRRGAIPTAGVLSVTALATFAFVMGHPTPYRTAAQNGPMSPIEYEGSGLLDSHQIVELVRTTILQHSDDKRLSKQIADTLTQEDRLGDFQRVQTSEELASLLTKRVRQVSHDSRYQVLYSATPPDLAEAHGRSIYRITEHLSVALPSL